MGGCGLGGDEVGGGGRGWLCREVGVAMVFGLVFWVSFGVYRLYCFLGLVGHSYIYILACTLCRLEVILMHTYAYSYLTLLSYGVLAGLELS